MKQKIIDLMHEITEMLGGKLIENLQDDSVLLETGMDSMGFAVLVAKLEEDLGVDPFSIMDDPVYPRTLAEFVAVYERYAPQ